MLSLFGDFARKTTEPIQTNFDNLADCAIMLAERHNLLSSAKRRFSAVVNDTAFFHALDYSQFMPAVTLVDPERGVSFTAYLTSGVPDEESDSVTIGLWGSAP